MWPRKKSTPQTVTGTDKEWSQTGTLVHKPPRGWLHADTAIIDGGGVLYCVQYVGLMKIFKSMRSLKFEDRTQVTREAMMRCVEESGVRSIKKRKVPKHISKMLGDKPIVSRAGTNVNLRISIDGLKLTAVDSGELIADHGMPSISFATGGEGEGIDFIGYVAKDQVNDRACHCFDCGDLAYDIITTVGQAFELRYKTYLTTKAVPLEIPGFGEGRGSGMGFDDESSTATAQSNIPPPPRRGALPSVPTATPSEKLQDSNGMYDTLKEKSKKRRADNYYDLEGPAAAGGAAAAAAAAAAAPATVAMATHEAVPLKKLEEDPGYSSVKENGPGGRRTGAAGSERHSSYDNPNIFHEQDNETVTYDNPESRERKGNGGAGVNLAHGGAARQPSNNPSFDDSIYDNSTGDEMAAAPAQNGHHHRAYPPASQQQHQQHHQQQQYPGNAAAHNKPVAALHNKMPPAVHSASHPNHPSMPLPPIPGSGPAAAAVAGSNGGHGSSHGGHPYPPQQNNGHIGGPPVPAQDINHDLMAHDWFHGILSREEAENILEEDGEFLVRESSTQPGQYVLSGMENARVKHLLLVDPEGVVRTRDRVFASVPELIHYHIEHSLPIVSAGSSLTLGTAVVIDMSQE
ncbi:SHC-transforming protein 1-like isoform X2 [Sycon ciliatum]|uniref:SHC-transforming protein 1-like isoform X2 n=1 Tax=Sycon ciliatum TaxID=27933 RepID=UPI0020AD61A5